jgi:hypothetical protein
MKSTPRVRDANEAARSGVTSTAFTSVRHTLLIHLLARRGPMNGAELDEVLGFGETLLGELIADLVGNGLVLKQDDSRYRLSTPALKRLTWNTLSLDFLVGRTVGSDSDLLARLSHF